MQLWRRASGAFKDRNSIWIASLVRKTDLRNPEIESTVIKATSHNESAVDYRNSQRVFSWISMSPAYLRPVIWALCMRIEKTQSWVVTLKSLMLMHGVFCCRVPSVQRIGRLPFNLSNFTDGHLSPGKAWGFNAFIRGYYAFLDQKSCLLFMEMQERRERLKRGGGDDEQPLEQELARLQKLQALLDTLFQIKPQAEGMRVKLIIEAMDCIVIEVYDVYSIICNAIARVLVRIGSAGMVEATMAIEILQKATEQGEELSLYLDFCREMGIANASACPKVNCIPEEDMRQLKKIINGITKKAEDMAELRRIIDGVSKLKNTAIKVKRKRNKPTGTQGSIVDEEKGSESQNALRTIITDKWEVFDEDLIKLDVENDSSKTREDPFGASCMAPPLQPQSKIEDLPDLISFL